MLNAVSEIQGQDQTYPSNRQIDFDPDGLGRPTQAGSYAYNLDYAPSGRLTDLTYGNGITYGATPNTRNLPDIVQYRRGSTLLANRDFDWDENGNPLSITDSVNGTVPPLDTIFRNGFEFPQTVGTDDRSYQYDQLDRLQHAYSQHVGGTTDYRYDPLGNLRQRSGAGPNIIFDYDATHNRLETDTSGGTSRSWVYDDRGNVTAAGSFTMVHDRANEVTANSVGTTFAYDARGWRVKKVGNGHTQYFVYDASHHLVARQDNGTLTEFVNLGSRPIARIGNGVTTYVQTDYQNSPLFETDATGTATRRPYYGTYGVTDAEGVAEIPGYAGSAPDLTGLNYMGARYYHPGSGRFLSPDPAGLNPLSPTGLNRYVYAADNPAKNVDPTGEKCRTSPDEELSGCWNTPPERKAAENGGWRKYYHLAGDMGNDPYAKRAGKVAANSGDGFEGLLDQATNVVLRNAIVKSLPVVPNPSLARKMVASKMENIRIGLVRARVAILDQKQATSSHPVKLRRSEIAGFHRSVFQANGVSGDLFGGTIFDALLGKPGRMMYDWCPPPSCYAQ